MDDLPQANPTLRAVLIGVGIVLLLLLLSPLGLCAHHCYEEGKKKERQRKAEIVRACERECIDVNYEAAGPCGTEMDAAEKTFKEKAKKKYSRLKRKNNVRIYASWDKIGKLKNGLREGKASPDTEARIKALYKTSLKLQSDNLKL